MKSNILLFSCFLSIFYSIGQNINPEDLNFKLDQNKKVIWEKTYKFEANKDSLAIILMSFLKNNVFTTTLSITGDGFFGQSNKVFLSSTKNMAIGARNAYNATIHIKIMDGKYLVTITEIVFDGMQFNYPIIGKKSPGPPQFFLEDFVVKNKKPEFRINKGVMSQLSVLNKDFNSYFTINRAINN